MELFGRKEGRTVEEWLAFEEKDPEKKVEYYTNCLELNPE